MVAHTRLPSVLARADTFFDPSLLLRSGAVETVVSWRVLDSGNAEASLIMAKDLFLNREIEVLSFKEIYAIWF